eukprot:5380752-Amphidinium_carterae.3
MNHSGVQTPMQKVPRVSTVIMSIEGEEKCTAHEEIEPIGPILVLDKSSTALRFLRASASGRADGATAERTEAFDPDMLSD